MGMGWVYEEFTTNFNTHRLTFKIFSWCGSIYSKYLSSHFLHLDSFKFSLNQNIDTCASDELFIRVR